MIRIINNTEINDIEKELINYLYNHDKDFPIPITNKVDIEKYVQKILKLGHCLISFDNKKIVGILIYYDNDIETNTAFLSLVSVDKEYRNQGIASKMINHLIKNMENVDYIKYIDVPTHITNETAIILYKKFGFKFTGIKKEDNTIILRKVLE